MKNCPNCGAQLDDSAMFCSGCGFNFAAGQPQQPQSVYDPFDHTAEFDPKDISENKVLAMTPYVLGFVGIIICLLAINNSKYVAFNVKQALKVTICLTISALVCIVPFLGWLAYGIIAAICLVVDIIGFFNVCKGKAKELPIICKLGFLK